jgi:hypothetical protein
MLPNQALINNNSASSTFADLWQWISSNAWVNVGQVVGPIGPQGFPGDEGPTGPSGPPGDEIFVGADDPRATRPEVDLWFDTDAPDPVGGDVGLVAVLKANLRHHAFLGPWLDTNANAKWTTTLPAGQYMVWFQVASLSTGTGSRGVNLYIWFNTAGVHHAMSPDVGVVTLTEGPHEFFARDNGSVAGDSNDRGALWLIPITE